MKRSVDITGQVFGKLTALSLEMPELAQNRYWLCQCSCGQQKVVRQYNLSRGATQSCGCIQKSEKRIKEDLTGKTFGKLTVLARDIEKIGKIRGSYWLCKCECGETVSTSRHGLVNKGVASCSCLQKEVARKRTKPNGGADRNSWINKYKRRAKEKGIEFTLTDEEFFHICSQNCYYCDAPPVHRSHGYVTKLDLGKFYANGIDKIDPTIGYVIYNCVPCCKMCNFMKTNKSLEVFVNKAFEIADNMRKKNVQKS